MPHGCCLSPCRPLGLTVVADNMGVTRRVGKVLLHLFNAINILASRLPMHFNHLGARRSIGVWASFFANRAFIVALYFYLLKSNVSDLVGRDGGQSRV